MKHKKVLMKITLILLVLILFIPKIWQIPEKEIKMEKSEIKGKIGIITVYDNYLVNPELKTGWGFACWIKIGEKNILFDTGADFETLSFNTKKMGLDFKDLDIIFLSHIHGDHTGGLEGVLKEKSNLTVYIPHSFPNSIREMISSSDSKWIDVKSSKEISKGVFSTGELGTWIKEQSLVINSDKGLLIITGCAHPGIVNIVKKVKENFPEKNIYLVLGGFHLFGVSDEELKEIVNEFKNLGIEKVAPCHCSGDRCRELFREEYKENFIENGVGKIIEI